MADQKITDMTAATALDRDDVLPVVQDTATTPVNRKTTLNVLDPGNALGGTAGASSALAVGADATAAGSGLRRTAVGQGANADDTDGTAVGYDAFARYRCVAVGRGASAPVGGDVAVGAFASAGGSIAGTRKMALGEGAATSGSATRAIAVGGASSATVADTVAVGDSAVASGLEATAVGASADATAGQATALGRSAQAIHVKSVALGHVSATTADDQVAIGPRHLELRDVTTPATPTVATAARLAVRDNGGTQELVVVFGNGEVVPVVDDENARDLVLANVETDDYTLALSDAGKAVEMDKATANTVTVPPEASVDFPIGTVIEVAQVGEGQTTVVAGAGVTIRTPETLVLTGQWSTVSLRKRGSDEWLLAGDVEPS